MSRSGYKLLGLLGDFKAAQRGPGALARRLVRKEANKHSNRWLRKAVRP